MARASPAWREGGRGLVSVSLTVDIGGSSLGAAMMLVPALGVRRSSSSSVEKSMEKATDTTRDAWRGPAASVWPMQVGLAERHCEQCTNDQDADCRSLS